MDMRRWCAAHHHAGGKTMSFISGISGIGDTAGKVNDGGRAARLAPFAPKRPAWGLGLGLSTIVALLFYGATAKSIEHDSGQRFGALARTAQHNMASQVKSYADLMRNTASLFELSDEISRAQFHQYVQSLGLAQHYPAVEFVSFVRHVTEAERPAYEARAALQDTHGADGYPPLRITPQPAPARASYALLTYIEPIDAAAPRYGYDIGAAPAQARLLTAARDSGAAILEGRPNDMAPRPSRQSIAIQLPVYHAGMPTDSVAQRREAYLGMVGVAFCMKTMARAALDEMAVPGVRLELFDGGPHGAPGGAIHAADQALFDSQRATPRAPWWRPDGAADRLTTTLPIDYGNRLWKARFSVPKDAFYTRFDGYVPWLALGAGFISTMLLYALFHTLASSRRRALQMAKAMTQELRGSQVKLQLSHQKLRRLAAHADRIKEEERKRIAREIHDDLGQNLLVLRIDADMLASRTAQHHPRLHARARSTLSQIDTTIKSVRHIINDLRPTVLDLGLNAAVEWQIAEFRRRTGIVCELQDGHAEIHVNDHCATAFFRILQESLSNISQHARASLVQVVLRKDDDTLSMTVRDNGVGVSTGGRNKVGSFGLVGIEERIKILGGSSSVISTPRGGTTLHVSAPVGADTAGFAYLNPSADAEQHAPAH